MSGDGLLSKLAQSVKQSAVGALVVTDFRNRDPLAYQLLGMDAGLPTSRRWFYLITKAGKRIKICHRVEPQRLEGLPGETLFYSQREELLTLLKRVLRPMKSIAVMYSPRGEVPFLSTVDAGTVELLKTSGVKVQSAIPIVHRVLGVVSEAQLKLHHEASVLVDEIRNEAFIQIASGLSRGVTDREVFNFILERFKQEKLTTEGEPMVGINERPVNPHFDLSSATPRKFAPGDAVLIDLWAKVSKPGAIFFDSTWCGYIKKAPRDYEKVFDLVRRARDAGFALIERRSKSGDAVAGFEVDRTARQIIEKGGYGKYFVHRLGHSIGENIHSVGANLDDFETHDTRELLAGSCFSIEPGIYLPKRFAVRLEVSVTIDSRGSARISGELQEKPVVINS